MKISKYFFLIIFFGVVFGFYPLPSFAEPPAQAVCEARYNTEVQNLRTNAYNFCQLKNCETIESVNEYFQTAFGSLDSNNDCQQELLSKRGASPYGDSDDLFYQSFQTARSQGLITPTQSPLGAVPTLSASQQGDSGSQTVDPNGPTIDPATPVGGDVEDAISKATTTCGIAGEACCIADLSSPDVPVPLPGGIDVFVKFLIDKAKVWIDFPRQEMEASYYKTTKGALCNGTLEPMIPQGEGYIAVKNEYDMSAKSYQLESCVSPTAEGKCTSIAITPIPVTKAVPCTCIDPEDPEGMAALGAGGEESEVGAGEIDEAIGNVANKVWDATTVDIICKKESISQLSPGNKANYDACVDCYLNQKRYWLATANICAAQDIHNMANLCRATPGEATDVGTEKGKCYSCMAEGKLWTALGCIDLKMDSFIQNQLFGWGLGLAGLSAFLCIIYSAFIFQTSSNNPEKITQAQDTMTSCITGLIVIIFSVFILNIIGVDILKIPGFSRGTPTPTVETPTPSP
jgi:hypothetical protein